MRGTAYIRLKRSWALCGLFALSAGLLIATTASAVSPASTGELPVTQLVSRASVEPTATADGRFVFFMSYATNFTPSQPARGPQLFRHDMRTDQTTLVPTVGHQPERPVVSANGRFLAYVSTLDPRSDHAVDEIFVRDLRTGSTRLASRRDGANGAPANKPVPRSYLPSVDRPSVSANGRYLAFVSDSPNLFPGDNGAEKIPPEIYVRDLKTDTTTLVSRASGLHGEVANRGCAEPEISADGLAVAFTCSSTNLGARAPQPAVFAGQVFVRNLTTAKTTAVSRTHVPTTSYAPAISASGRYVAFLRGRTASPVQVFERDMQSGQTILVSKASGDEGAPANGFTGRSSSLGISPDGSLVAFLSRATNLGGPTDTTSSGTGSGLYLRDIRAKQTTFVHWEGWAKPRLVGGGRYLIFGTYAPGDIYRYDRGPAS